MDISMFDFAFFFMCFACALKCRRRRCSWTIHESLNGMKELGHLFVYRHSPGQNAMLLSEAAIIRLNYIDLLVEVRLPNLFPDNDRSGFGHDCEPTVLVRRSRYDFIVTHQLDGILDDW